MFNPFSGVWKYVAAAGGAIAAVALIFMKGGDAREDKIENEALKDSFKKQKDGQDAVAKEKRDTDGDDAGVVVDRMRGRDWT